jgi:hypothetical protein
MELHATQTEEEEEGDSSPFPLDSIHTLDNGATLPLSFQRKLFAGSTNVGPGVNACSMASE